MYGTQSSKVTEDKVYYAGQGEINFLDNFIYYKNELDSKKVYRVKPNGKGRQRFGSVVTISSVDDIYVNIKTNFEYTLPKTVIAHVSEGLDSEYDVIWDSVVANTTKPGVYSFEGTVEGYDQKVKLVLTVEDTVLYGNTHGNISNKSRAAESGDWIYYFSKSQLKKVKIDGTSKGTITNGVNVQGINIIGDWIYFLQNRYLFKIKTDGTGKINLTDDEISEINIAGDWIYYVNIDSGGIYKMKMDGTQKIKMNRDTPQSMIVQNGWIYYLNSNEIYRMRSDGTEIRSCNIRNVKYFDVVGNYIYYDYDGYIYESKTDGTESISITDIKDLFSINVSGDWIYYTDNTDIYIIKTDGTSKTFICDDDAKRISLVGEWIYYIDYYLNVYRIKTDGTGREKLD